MGALRANFLGADFRPVGLTAGSRALVRVVDDLQWLADRVTDTTGELLAEMREPVVHVLRGCTSVLDTSRADVRDSHRAELAYALAWQRAVAQSRYRDDIVEILGEDSDASAIGTGRKLLTRRTISACVGATGGSSASPPRQTRGRCGSASSAVGCRRPAQPTGSFRSPRRSRR